MLKMVVATLNDGLLVNYIVILTADSAVRTDSLLCRLIRAR